VKAQIGGERGRIIKIELSKLNGKKLRRFTAALHRAHFEGAQELEVIETRHWLTLRWKRGAWKREVSIGPRGGIKSSEREWWSENTGEVE
jgi:hypothetical protein